MRIKADLRALTEGQPVTNFTDKAFSGATSFTVANSADFHTDGYVLIGNLSSETTEFRKITVSGSTFTVTALSFDHPQDAPITGIGYDQVVFYYSATVTGILSQLGNNVNITPDSYYTYYDDTSNSTGYGWFKFYNSQTGVYSALSNAVPYADFDANSVKKMLDRFFTSIGNRERKLIKDNDAIEWLNEGYAIARNRLNLSNRSYNVPTPYTLNLVAGTAEYALPTQFSKVRTLNYSDGRVITEISLDDAPNYRNVMVPPAASKEIKYYLRNNYIGFTPTPTESLTVYLYYQTSSPTLTSYLDYVDIPGGNYYFLLDFMLFRSANLTGGNAANYLQSFNNGMNSMIINLHKMGDHKDSIDAMWSSLV